MVTLELPEPPDPEHESVYVLLPAFCSVISSFPDVTFDPDQAPEAEQEVAFEEDQVRVNGSLALMLETELLKLTEGAGVDIDPPPDDPAPPPPPPPQAVSARQRQATENGV